MLRSLATLLLTLGTPYLWSAETKQPVTVSSILRPAPDRGGPITWAPNGDQFVSQKDGKLLLYNVKSGKSRELINLSRLAEEADKPVTPPTTDWTNRRVSEGDVAWFPNAKRLLVTAEGDLFTIDLKGNFEQLTHTSQVERDPKLSPNGEHVSFRRGPDLFVLDIESKQVRQLTHDGSDTLLNGQTDWVYPEELDLGTAHWWSPDSQSIAYLQFDIGHEPVFPQVFLLRPRGLLEPERYPKAGDPNAEVRLGIVPVKGGETHWMNLGETRNQLLARVAWLPDSRSVTAVKLNRVQNKLDLYVADAQTGTARVAIHEESRTWINTWANEAPRFLPSGDRFLWLSERDGFCHVYLFNVAGQMLKQLTSGSWMVTGINAATDDEVFFTSTEASPLERQLYAVRLDGSGKRRLTVEGGTHTASVSPDGSYFLDEFSSVKDVPRATLYRDDGSKVRVYREPDKTEADQFEILPSEIVKVKAADGTDLFARLIKPAGFVSNKKYPAIVMIYGGPGVQVIHNSWSGATLDQVLAQKGYVIWQLDNRGSSGRGHAFEAAIYHHLGVNELQDQKAGIDALVKLGFVDPQRLGMFGWSYGGFMTLFTATNAPGLIKAAVAGAPVTSWRNYDSIYTERYMGLPEDNPADYKESSPQTRASSLQSKLLIIHNLEDDNVHFANTMQMADALERAGKPFFMLTYPQKSHGVGGPVRRHLYESIVSFFDSNLQ